MRNAVYLPWKRSPCSHEGWFKGRGQSSPAFQCSALPSPAWCVLCLLSGVADQPWVFLGFMLCWQRVALQPVPGAAHGCVCLPSRGVSEPRCWRNGPSRPLQSSHRHLMGSALISDIVTMCSYRGDPFRGVEEQDFSNPSWGLSQQLHTEGNQVKKTPITAPPKIIKRVKYLCVTTKQGGSYAWDKT